MEGSSMKPRVLAGLLTLALVPAAAGAASLGLGVYGGMRSPILNDTAGNGPQYGVRAPVTLAPMLIVEPFYAQSALGDVDQSFGGNSYTRTGPDGKTFGTKPGFRFREGGTFH